MTSGFNKFLQSGSGNISGLQDGTQPINSSTLTAANLMPSLPCKTNASSIINSTLLDIADTTGLQLALDAKVANPLTSNLDAGQFDITNISELKIDTAGGGSNIGTLQYNGTGNQTFDLDNLGGVSTIGAPVINEKIVVYDGTSGDTIKETTCSITAGVLSLPENIVLNSVNNNQTILGHLAGQSVGSSNANTYIGSEAGRLATTFSNTFIGYQSGENCTAGNNNVAIGQNTLSTSSGGSGCVAIGSSALQQANGVTSGISIGVNANLFVTTGDQNVTIGSNAGGTVNTGSRNLCLGDSSGSSLSGADSDNIIIKNPGVTGSDQIIIGTQGTQTSCKIAGIYQVTPGAGSDETVIMDSAGQFGTVSQPAQIGSTGVLSGGILTVNGGDSTLFDISAGTGTLYNPNTLINTNVSWSAYVAQTTTYTGILTFVSMNSSGVPIYQSTKLTNDQTRDRIFLGVLVHVNGVDIDVTNDEQVFLSNPTNSLRDFTEAMGFINISGNILSASGSNLKLAKSSGSMFKFGANFKNDLDNPHVISNPAIDTAIGGGFPDIFQYRMSDGSSSALTLTDVIPNIQDSGGAYPGTTYGNGRFGVARVFVFTSGNLKIQPDISDYKNMDQAIESITLEPYTIEPSLVQNGMLIGYMVTKGDATDLTDANDFRFLPAGKLGSISGGSSSGGDCFTNASTSTLNRVALFADTSGKLLKEDTAVTINAGIISGVANVNLTQDVDDNCRIGFTALNSIASGGQFNTAFGTASLQDCTTGDRNTGVGFTALEQIITASDNTGIGYHCFHNATSANNTGIGSNAGQNVTTGDSNIAVGHLAGSGWTTTASDNICIGNLGIAADQGEIRIGTAATHVKNFTAGIVGVTPDNTDGIPMFVSSVGQLGTVGITPLPNQYVGGFLQSNTSTTVVTFGTTGELSECRSSDNTFNLTWSGTKTITTSVTGVGGISDTYNPVVANQGYEVYAVGDTGGTATNILAINSGTNITAAIEVSGGTYDVYKRIGWFVTEDGSTSIIPYVCAGKSRGRHYHYEGRGSQTVLFAGSSTTWVNMSSGGDGVEQYTAPGSHHCVLRVAFGDTASSSEEIGFRPNGSSVAITDALYTFSSGSSLLAGELADFQSLVHLGSDRVLNYIVSSGLNNGYAYVISFSFSI